MKDKVYPEVQQKDVDFFKKKESKVKRINHDSSHNKELKNDNYTILVGTKIMNAVLQEQVKSNRYQKLSRKSEQQ